MTFLNCDRIRQCLEELSDKSYQERIWTASSGPEISSLTEAQCQLFNDSGLDLLLEKDGAFGDQIDGLLKDLRLRLKNIDHNRPPLDIINDPQMVAVRKLSAQILNQLPIETKTLPAAIKEKILAMQEYTPGVTKLRVKLKDGRTYSSVVVSSAHEIVQIGPSKEIPFSAEEVVDVENAL
jgi:hypothetical protein